MAFTTDTKFFYLAHQGIYLMLLIFQLPSQLMILCRGVVWLLPPLPLPLLWLALPSPLPQPFGIPPGIACNLLKHPQNNISGYP